MTRRRNADCFLTMCDGSGWIDITEDPDTEQERCPCGRADRDAEARVQAGLALAARIESEAMRSYRQPPDRLDPIVTVRRIRIALGLEGPT